MRICCTSDFHGYFPKVPDCDLLLLAGDYSPNPKSELSWLSQVFAPWLRKIADRGIPIVGVAGNHDLAFERRANWLPSMPWTYLQDSGMEFGGLKIWGSPWQPTFHDWAFNLPERKLAAKWNLIPVDTDILLLHGPPYGCGDWTPNGNSHCGSLSLARRIDVIKPRLVVAGHIHHSYGQYQLGTTLVVNAAHVDESYRPVNPPIVIDLPARQAAVA